MTLNIKRIFFITFLLAIYQEQSIQAMQGGDSEHTETEIAQEQEDQTGQYINVQKRLIYKPKNTVKRRIEHIKQHLRDDRSKLRHTYFNQGTDEHNDIIGFIGIIIDRFRENNIDPASQDRSRNIAAGQITLHAKQYNVVDNYDGVQHTYDINPADLGDRSYPPLGTKGGRKGDRAQIYGYRLTLSHTTDGIEIESFHLSNYTL